MHRVEVRVSVLIHLCLDPPAFNVTILPQATANADVRRGVDRHL